MAEGNHSKPQGGKAKSVGVLLKPAGQGEQPKLVNYSYVSLAQGVAYIDFGFLEPASLNAVMQRMQRDEGLPKHLEGTRAARVALPLDAMVRLYQQIQQLLVGLQPSKSKPS
ncbi:hypothetical protein FBQ96_02615 [Nitrospirales bacterium NOB]|nr:MAG: hypothetical protein UZ03_NOB001000514 [Nitrospira sp. OLB3]MBV6469831.1 hypothetical protein [Nitrospirota bacterium]MCE7967026.1 hypothetical protein [Nitrospira sp. NTP2]MDL1888470.1 hypothetical protein [Nitrospirales bacterium NOB]MEB2340294.1 hypothetical protein [Nitrospirales bacterium]QOJ36259.1 MAG: hypothetical protein HRU82_15520 [Nitrospira sp.]